MSTYEERLKKLQEMSKDLEYKEPKVIHEKKEYNTIELKDYLKDAKSQTKSSRMELSDYLHRNKVRTTNSFLYTPNQTMFTKENLSKDIRSRNYKNNQLLEDSKKGFENLHNYNTVMNTEKGKTLKENVLQARDEESLARYNYNVSEIADGLKKSNPLERTAKKVQAGIMSMIPANIGTTIRNEKGEDIQLPNYGQILNSQISEKQKGPEKVIGDVAYQSSRTLVSTLLNGMMPYLGTTTYFATMMDEQYNNARREGYSNEKALTYSIVSGATEALTSKALGSTVGLFKKSSGVEEALSSGLKKVIGNKTINKILANAGSESLEEFVQEYVDQAERSIILDEDNDILSGETLKNAMYSGLIGALSGGLNSTVQSLSKSTIQKNVEQALYTAEKNNKITLNKAEKIQVQNKVYESILDNKKIDFKGIAEEVKQNRENKINNLMESSRILTPTKEINNLLNTTKKIIEDKGYNITFDTSIQTDEGTKVAGLITTNERGEIDMRLNPLSDRAMEFVLMHEVTHAIETKEIKKLIIDYAQKQPNFNEALESLKNTYKTDDVSSEVLADISGQLFGNQEFINNLSVEQPNVFRRIYNAIISLTNKITGNSNEALFMKDLKNKWEEAYRTQNNNLNGNEYSFPSFIERKKNTSSNNLTEAAINEITQKTIEANSNKSNVEMVDINEVLPLKGNGGYRSEEQIVNLENNIRANGIQNPIEIMKRQDGSLSINDGNHRLAVAEKFGLKQVPIKYVNDYIENYSDVLYNDNDVNFVEGDYDNGSSRNIKKTIENDDRSRNKQKNSDDNSFIFKNRRGTRGNETISNKVARYNNRPSGNSTHVQNVASERRRELDDSSFSLKQTLKNYDGEIIDIINLQENDAMKIRHYNRKYDKNNIAAYRGESDDTSSNGAFYGLGLYTTLDKKYASQYGNVQQVDNSLLPDNPLIFKTQNDFQLWEQELARELGTRKSKLYSDDYGVEQYIKKLGYDGLMIGTGKDTDLISFKNVEELYNKNDTDNLSSDTKYSQNSDKWQDYIENNYKTTGTRTYTKKSVIPIPNKPKLSSITNDSNYDKIVSTSKNFLKDDNLSIKENINNPIIDDDSKNSFSNNKTTKLLDKRPEYIKLSTKDIKNKFVREIVNEGEAIDRLAKKTGNKELTYKYDHIGTSEAEGNYSIAIAQTDNYGNKVGKSIVEIWKPVEETELVEEFSNYLLHKHNISRYEQGKPVFGNDVTSDMSKDFVNQSEKDYPQFKDWAKDVYTYNKNQLQNMVDAGLTSEESQEYLNSTYDNYVRIYRDIKGQGPITQYKNNLKVNVPIKKAKGGNQDILPLKDSMAQQTIEIKKAIRRNEFGLELLNTLQNGETTTYDGKQTVIKNDDGTYSFTVYKEGNPIKIEIDEGLYDALKPKENNDPVILAPIRVLSKVQRGLLTDKNPLFIATNFFKDIGDAPFNSKYASKFYKNYVIGLKNIATNSELWNKYQALGGEQNTYFDYRKGVSNISKSRVSKFVRGIQRINQVVEQAPRFAEFISTLETGGSYTEAMYNAAEVTTNFKRGGDITKAINRNGANFLNASVQGFDKQIRNLKGQNGVKGYINLLSKAIILGVAPSIINHLLLDDDDDYKDLPDYVKDSYFLFKTSDNNFIRIPKGRVVSIFGMSARRTLEYANGEKDAFKGMGTQIANQVAPNNPLEDNVVAPFIAVKNNVSWNGSPVVPTRLQDEKAENQYDEKTDEISKFVGKIFKVSPKKINYILDQYSGGIGDTFLPLITPQAHKNPISSKFTTDSIINNKNVSDFYDLKDELTAISNSTTATDEDALKSKYFNSVNFEMNELYKKKREIQNSKISNKEKLVEIAKIQTQINDIAKFALEDYQDYYIDNNYSYVGDKEFYKNSKNQWEKVDDKLKKELDNLDLNFDEKNDYLKYKVDIGKIKSDKELDSETKHSKISSLLLESKLSEKNIASLYGSHYSTENKLKSLIDLKIPIKDFIRLNSQDFESDYNSKGKTIRNSRKEKIVNYINGLDLNVSQKAILIKMQYNTFKSYDNKIIKYVEGLGKTKNEQKLLLRKIGFDKYNKDVVKYILSQDISDEEIQEQLDEYGFRIINGEVYSK